MLSISSPVAGHSEHAIARLILMHFGAKQRHHVLESIGMQEMTIFRQTAVNFLQRRLWVLIA